LERSGAGLAVRETGRSFYGAWEHT